MTAALPPRYKKGSHFHKLSGENSPPPAGPGERPSAQVIELRRPPRPPEADRPPGPEAPAAAILPLRFMGVPLPLREKLERFDQDLGSLRRCYAQALAELAGRVAQPEPQHTVHVTAAAIDAFFHSLLTLSHQAVNPPPPPDPAA